MRRSRGRHSVRAALRLRLRDPAADEQGECCENDGDRSRALEHLTGKFTAVELVADRTVTRSIAREAPRY
jgi:hypothetical protein